MLKWPERKALRPKGRSRGSVTRAIGLPNKRAKLSKNIPFFKETTAYKINFMVNLFIKDRCSSSPIHSISEIVDDAANLSSALLDENVDIFQIKDKFTNDAWDKVVDLYRRRKDLPWICPACHMQIAEFPSVGCDSCLEWIHISCANLKKIPKTRFWYCGACKL